MIRTNYTRPQIKTITNNENQSPRYDKSNNIEQLFSFSNNISGISSSLINDFKIPSLEELAFGIINGSQQKSSLTATKGNQPEQNSTSENPNTSTQEDKKELPKRMPPEYADKGNKNSRSNKNRGNQFGRGGRYNKSDNNNVLISKYNKPFDFGKANGEAKADSDNGTCRNSWSFKSYSSNKGQSLGNQGTPNDEAKADSDNGTRRNSWSFKSYNFNNRKSDKSDDVNTNKRSYRYYRQDNGNKINKHSGSRKREKTRSADTKFLLQTLKNADKAPNGIISREEANALSWIYTFAPVPPDSPTAKTNEQFLL